jgi:hypothetical protein
LIIPSRRKLPLPAKKDDAIPMSVPIFCVENGNIYIEREKVELPYPVDTVIVFDNLLVVRLEPSAKRIFNRNVLAIGSDGTVIWQIVESPHGATSDKPYVTIYVDSDGNLVAGNWNGVDYVVEIATGKIKTKSFNK